MPTVIYIDPLLETITSIKLMGSVDKYITKKLGDFCGEFLLDTGDIIYNLDLEYSPRFPSKKVFFDKLGVKFVGPVVIATGKPRRNSELAEETLELIDVTFGIDLPEWS